MAAVCKERAVSHTKNEEQLAVVIRIHRLMLADYEAVLARIRESREFDAFSDNEIRRLYERC